jgi:ribosome biogenesis protein BRX1
MGKRKLIAQHHDDDDDEEDFDEDEDEDQEVDGDQDDDDEDDEDDADAAAAPRKSSSAAAAASSSTKFVNKQRTLIIASRGISHRDRHLLADLRDLMPHSKKDSKFDGKVPTA